MRLFVLRHADAGDPEAWVGPDAARPLSDKGQRQAEHLGRFLADNGFVTDLLLSSPKVRARETAELVAERIGTDVVEDERLAGGIDLDHLEAILRDHGLPERPLLVGHDPDCSDTVSDLSGGPVAMRKGALARVDVDMPLEPGAGTLRWLIPPDALKSER